MAAILEVLCRSETRGLPGFILGGRGYQSDQGRWQWEGRSGRHVKESARRASDLDCGAKIWNKLKMITSRI